MRFFYEAAVILLAVQASGCSKPGTDSIRADAGKAGAAPAGSTERGQINILTPFDGALFPPEIAPPTFLWEDGNPACDTWRIDIQFGDGQPMQFRSGSQQWTPTSESWESIKLRSRQSEAVVTIAGASRVAPDAVLSRGSVSIGTSADEVGAPIFYREVVLPFREAVKDPSRIRWRFGEISRSEQPPIVLENLLVCGNCHSFSADGAILGMDVDYANDRGSYAITPVSREMILDDEKIITWSDYKREDKETTFGLLSQVSPDGRYVVSTVKDRSVFVATDDLAFSQLFFPVKGILAIYDRKTREFHALPGADDPAFVQSNATWSPDGKYLVFARSKAHRLKHVRDDAPALLTAKQCQEFLKGGKSFLFDLYRIPFNGGKGGTPEPLAGASHNGMSNYFPKVSPDGEWIVFCRAKSFMLLQPDSELHIIPSGGGEARRLACNTARMNSWHSWSPNGRWLVFSSKALSLYTQLFLTHIDEQGESSVPVVLSRFTSPDRAANIPEFVHTEAGAIQGIVANFLDDLNYLRAAFAFLNYGRDSAAAAPLLRKSLEINPDNIPSRLELAEILVEEGKLEEAKAHIAHVLEIEPDHVKAHHSLAMVLSKEEKPSEAVDHCRRALEASPDSPVAHLNLGRILLETGRLDESVGSLAEALRLQPDDPMTNYLWGSILHRRAKPAEAATYYRRAVELDPEFIPAMLAIATLCISNAQTDSAQTEEALALAKRASDLTGNNNLQTLRVLAAVYAVAGEIGKAADTARKALEIARAAGDQVSADRIQKMLNLYEEVQAERGK